jgi:hypothetical protein
MKTTTESIIVVTNEKGAVIAIVRKDVGLQKNLIYRVGDATMSDIEGLLSGTADLPSMKEEKDSEDKYTTF